MRSGLPAAGAASAARRSATRSARATAQPDPQLCGISLCPETATRRVCAPRRLSHERPWYRRAGSYVSLNGVWRTVTEGEAAAGALERLRLPVFAPVYPGCRGATSSPAPRVDHVATLMCQPVNLRDWLRQQSAAPRRCASCTQKCPSRAGHAPLCYRRREDAIIVTGRRRPVSGGDGSGGQGDAGLP